MGGGREIGYVWGGEGAGWVAGGTAWSELKESSICNVLPGLAEMEKKRSIEPGWGINSCGNYEFVHKNPKVLEWCILERRVDPKYGVVYLTE